MLGKGMCGAPGSRHAALREDASAVAFVVGIAVSESAVNVTTTSERVRISASSVGPAPPMTKAVDSRRVRQRGPSRQRTIPEMGLM
jgi:hypothetical protein